MALENRNTSDDQPAGVMDVFSNGSFFDHHQQPQLYMNFADNNIQSEALVVPSLGLIADFSHDTSNGKKAPAHTVESFMNLSPTPASGSGLLSVNNKGTGMQGLSGRKRKRNNGRVVEKPREVIHVRAKRGQATDSHSLAERVRREKINERLRCLQDLVPGCYKTMGMAVMLDVIINYVRSLQNQIEFLSMKLSAASMYYDFNSELDTAETMPGTNECDAQDMERMVREGYGGPPYFHSAWSL